MANLLEKQSEKSSDFMMSDYDDKDDPNFFIKDEAYMTLPVNVRKAIENGKLKAKHSDFYYKLSDLNTKIDLYKKLFCNRIPQYQLVYIINQMEIQQAKQKKERIMFE